MRLSRDRKALANASTLVEECEYFRRLPELGDAEALIATSARM